MSGVGETFVQQSGPLTCVAACVTMLRRRRGLFVNEADVLAEWGKPPFTLQQAASDGSCEIDDPDDPASLELLRARLGTTWVVVLLMLVPRRPAHAVILTAANSTGLLYLDPAERRESQPLAITDAEFLGVWTGYLLVAAR